MQRIWTGIMLFSGPELSIICSCSQSWSEITNLIVRDQFLIPKQKNLMRNGKTGVIQRLEICHKEKN